MKMRIKNNEVENYLKTKDIFYRFGWECCNLGKDASSVRKGIRKKYAKEFEQGYNDCYANIESASKLEEIRWNHE